MKGVPIYVLITMAWLPIHVSVTLAALLTVGLVPVAIVRARRALAFAGMTLAMLGMMWRGEAWKTVFLQSEQQVLELQRQLRQPISSRAAGDDHSDSEVNRRRK